MNETDFGRPPDPLRLEVTRRLAERELQSALSSFLGYGLQAYLALSVLPKALVWGWLGLMLLLEGCNAAIAWWGRPVLKHPARMRSYLRLQTLGLLLSGSCWGLSALALAMQGDILLYAINVFVLVVVGAFSIHNLCLYLPALACFNLGLMLPVALSGLLQTQPYAGFSTAAALFSFLMILLYGHGAGRATRREIQTRFAMQSLTQELMRKNKDLTEAYQLIEEQAAHDSLTHCLNRRALRQRFQKLQERRRSEDVFLGALMIDVDHFKQINDRHGHAAGDLVLLTLVARIKEQLRAIDLLARWGGEEFLCLVFGGEGGNLPAVAERIRAAVAVLPIPFEGEYLYVTVSIGAARLREGEDFEALVRRADEALYRAKAGGRDQVQAD
ncbi:GGDEF domain-containing protein [Paucibacter sp. KBW04]|uniref:GGDEF domain-containing protein n=1 Tax=Paucibacter sp. KBW04 TaxID=2153361 RepID=UPI0018CC6C8F|nr:GGDEF domain-containing protein [Paucibacter sp. KBW04]